MLKQFLLVALGGALGAVARFAASTWIPRGDFPWATLGVNLLGSFLIGIAAASLDGPGRLLFVVGFLGAFTTLSTYSLETLQLWQAGQRSAAGANAAANAVGGPLMAILGWWVQRSVGP